MPRLWGRTLSKRSRETAAQPARRDRNIQARPPGLSGKSLETEHPGQQTWGLGVAGPAPGITGWAGTRLSGPLCRRH